MVFVVFVTTESDLGQCPFTLDDAFFTAAHGKKRFLDCVWVRLLPMEPKDHMQKGFYLTHSPCCPLEERQNLEGMGEVVAHGAKSLHTLVMNGWIP